MHDAPVNASLEIAAFVARVDEAATAGGPDAAGATVA